MLNFMSPTEEPQIFSVDAGSDVEPFFGSASPSLAGLLGDEPSNSASDDGYATTVEEDDFLQSTGLPEFSEFSFPDLKMEAPQHPGIMVDAVMPTSGAKLEELPEATLPLELAFSPRNASAFAAPDALEDSSFAGDESAAALLHVLTQAALQQTQLMQQQHQAHVPAMAPADSPSPASISPRDVRPTRSPTVPWAKAVSTCEAVDNHSRPWASPAANDAWSASTANQNKRKRRTRDASELLPLDAPVQKRTYFAPSATSRRELHELEDDDGDQDANVKALLDKRKKNTLAARQSRRRKAEELTQLKGENDSLVAENAELKRRLEDVETELASFRLRLEGIYPPKSP